MNIRNDVEFTALGKTFDTPKGPLCVVKDFYLQP